MPTRILPLGFTLNTLLAAAILLTITEGAGAWRLRARRRKGECPWCGYDRAGVAGDAACPECGRVA
jgi:rubrerythrin